MVTLDMQCILIEFIINNIYIVSEESFTSYYLRKVYSPESIWQMFVGK